MKSFIQDTCDKQRQQVWPVVSIRKMMPRADLLLWPTTVFWSKDKNDDDAENYDNNNNNNNNKNNNNSINNIIIIITVLVC